MRARRVSRSRLFLRLTTSAQSTAAPARPRRCPRSSSRLVAFALHYAAITCREVVEGTARFSRRARRSLKYAKDSNRVFVYFVPFPLYFVRSARNASRSRPFSPAHHKRAIHRRTSAAPAESTIVTIGGICVALRDDQLPGGGRGRGAFLVLFLRLTASAQSTAAPARPRRSPRS